MLGHWPMWPVRVMFQLWWGTYLIRASPDYTFTIRLTLVFGGTVHTVSDQLFLYKSHSKLLWRLFQKNPHLPGVDNAFVSREECKGYFMSFNQLSLHPHYEGRVAKNTDPVVILGDQTYGRGGGEKSAVVHRRGRDAGFLWNNPAIRCLPPQSVEAPSGARLRGKR